VLKKTGFAKVKVSSTQIFHGEMNRLSLCRKTVKTSGRMQPWKLAILIADGVAAFR
jgi:hypothetical protein